MKAFLKTINDIDYLYFKVPSENVGVSILPVITKGSRDDYKKNDEKLCVWSWNGDLEKPTLKPSILIQKSWKENSIRVHLFLNEGICKFLDDCNDGNANKELELLDLPEWVLKD
jgi:hypothetical protein